MKTIDFSYFIERYLAGEMNEAEEKWFKDELIRNEKLRDEVALRRLTDSKLRGHDILKLRNKLSVIEKDRAEAEKTRNPRKNLHFTKAAIMAGIIVGGTLLQLNTRNMTTEEVFDRFYKSYDVTTSVRSAEAIQNSDYSTAIEYYNIRDYRSAAHYFSKVLSNDPRYMESTMLIGVSRFEEENYHEAKQSFTKVLDDNNNYFLEDAQWYLALCYLKTSEKDKAVNSLVFIRESGSIYSDDARKILRKMK